MNTNEPLDHVWPEWTAEPDSQFNERQLRRVAFSSLASAPATGAFLAGAALNRRPELAAGE